MTYVFAKRVIRNTQASQEPYQNRFKAMDLIELLIRLSNEYHLFSLRKEPGL